MAITPEDHMDREERGNNPMCGCPIELILANSLAVDNYVTKLRTGSIFVHRIQGLEKYIGSCITVAVGVNLDVFLITDSYKFGYIFEGHARVSAVGAFFLWFGFSSVLFYVFTQEEFCHFLTVARAVERFTPIRLPVIRLAQEGGKSLDGTVNNEFYKYGR